MRAFADDSGAAATEDPNSIRPFHINIPESALADLRQRVLATRWDCFARSSGVRKPGPGTPLPDWNDGQPGTELNFKFYRQATNKIVGISDEAAAVLSEFF